METASDVIYKKAYEQGRADMKKEMLEDDGVPKQLLEMGYEQGRADERERIIRELEKLSDSYFQKVALDIIDIAIEIARGEENE